MPHKRLVYAALTIFSALFDLKLLLIIFLFKSLKDIFRDSADFIDSLKPPFKRTGVLIHLKLQQLPLPAATARTLLYLLSVIMPPHELTVKNRFFELCGQDIR